MLLPIAMLGGCSSFDLATKGGDMDGDTAAGEDSDASDSGTFDTAPPLDPAWYVLRAELTITDGVATTGAGTVILEVVDADLERVDCTLGLDLGLLAVGPASDDADAIVWWQLPVSPTDPTCAILPDDLDIGVGALHPDARARLGAVDHEDIADSLYGAWVRTDGGEANVFGYAGTALDLTGDDEASLPPADGTYTLAPLYLIPLPPQ